MERDFNDYQGLIIRLASSYSRTTGYDIEELIGLGTEVYCQCLHSFDDTKKAKFSTWLYTRLTQSFRDTVKRPRLSLTYCDSDVLSISTDDTARQFEFNEALSNLSPNAKRTVHAILSNPVAVGVGSGMSSKRLRGAVVAGLKRQGFYKNAAYAIVREIKEAVNSVAR